MPDYDQPFALRDNPFSPGPWIGGASPEFGSTDDLWTKPLRIHRVPRLETLFVAEAGPFKEYVERFDEVMDSKWFSKEQPSAPQVTLKFLIRGPVGAGKTTFANYLISQLSQYKLPPDKEWATVDYRSVAEFETMDSLKRIKAIADVFSKKVQQANYGALILDNLEVSDEQLVIHALDELGRERTVVAFMIAGSNSEFGKSAASHALYSAEFDLDFLSTGQAISFVRSRLNEFRRSVQNVPAWMAHDEWALFPFKQDHIETAVDLGVLGGVAEKRARPTIRNLGSMLKRALEAEMQRLRRSGDQGIRAVAENDIEKRTINLLRFVAQLTSTMTGKIGERKAA
ncbi:hypothetical protein KIP88_07875 [Bradyrhizobium sp. SRL28]|uniref:hypothetical protein n=1 Tax=Bradyrhizobium sp. SRL28 TaxID=2836178 RepID=UPI001BDF545D|nr:hypothetical protein [Bradyrhizobium sp. SRL28]MBT1510416.1 hypothetical protein [Bradyrhizobium sp. SRL28]